VRPAIFWGIKEGVSSQPFISHNETPEKDTPMVNNERDYVKKQVKEEADSALDLIIPKRACKKYRDFSRK
jgi:hypothetical protein